MEAINKNYGQGRLWRGKGGGGGVPGAPSKPMECVSHEAAIPGTHRGVQGGLGTGRGRQRMKVGPHQGGRMSTAPEGGAGVSRGWRVNLDGRGRCCRGSAGGTGSQANAEARTREGR